MPPWKAIHFPLPAQFEPPCTNMILCLTGFQERDRDYVKVGIAFNNWIENNILMLQFALDSTIR